MTTAEETFIEAETQPQAAPDVRQLQLELERLRVDRDRWKQLARSLRKENQLLSEESNRTYLEMHTFQLHLAAGDVVEAIESLVKVLMSREATGDQITRVKSASAPSAPSAPQFLPARSGGKYEPA